MSHVTPVKGCVTARDLEIGGVVCVSLSVVVADGTQSGFRGVGAWGVRAETGHMGMVSAIT
jgi:hypothetical protein